MTDEYLLYLRKSVGRMGIGLQRTIATKHLERRGARVVGEFRDTDSTAFALPGQPPPPRKDFAALLAELGRRPGIGIAAWHADRLLRNPEDTEILIRACLRGGHLIETARGGTYDVSQANGRKRLRDDANDAAYEVDHNRERILEKMAELRGEGRWGGGRRPFGWQVDAAKPGGLVLDDGEARLVADATAAVIGGVSLSAVAREWEKATGRRWNHVLVRQVLMRPLNAGLMALRGEVVGDGAWPPLVTGQDWRACRMVLADPGRRIGPGPERRHLLSGIALCGTCGGRLGISSAAGGPQYRCRRRDDGMRGAHAGRYIAPLDEFAAALAVGRLGKPDAAQLLRADHGTERGALLGAEAAQDALYAEQWALYQSKVITARELTDGRARIGAELGRIRGRLTELDQADALAPVLADPERTWPLLPLEGKRAVVRALMYVTVFPARRGRPAGVAKGGRYFDYESVDIRWVRALPSDG